MRLSRRQFLIAGAAVPGALSMPALAAQDAPLRRWRGVVMGAEAEIALATEDAAWADELVRQCLAEARRLEQVYSLYQPSSDLVRLNEDGGINHPAAELLEVLSTSRGLWEASGGAFDPSVQPLWRLYADWFSSPDADPSGPSAAARRQALARVGFDAVEIEPSAVRLRRPGMRLTLNGIAQGHMTDCVASLLRRQGLEHVLVAFGEIRALGSRPDHSPWRIGLSAPGLGQLQAPLALTDRAVATSAGAASPFGDGGFYNHILDPRTGLSPRLHAAVSVVAPSAMLADGLSTALSLLPPAQARSLLIRYEDTEAYLISEGGTPLHLS